MVSLIARCPPPHTAWGPRGRVWHRKAEPHLYHPFFLSGRWTQDGVPRASQALEHVPPPLPEHAFDPFGQEMGVGHWLFYRALSLGSSESVTGMFPTAQFEGTEKSCLSPSREEKGRLPPRLSAGNPKSAKPLTVEPSSPLGEWTDPALPLENQV